MTKSSGGEQSAAKPPNSQTPGRFCGACGAKARRADARYCSACGRSLEETYLPAGALRASYTPPPPAPRRRQVSRNTGRIGRSVKKPKSSMSSIMPATKNSNGASATALAFVTYALVPYLGILFCPGALLMGGVGLYQSYSAPERGGRRASYMGLALGLLLFCAQLFLWWILYKIPQWTKGF